MLDDDSLYRALASRDSRFDGVFFVGVTSTGVYCRPVCPAPLPKRRHCVFFETAAAAERRRYRGCLRCRPELAPGYASVDARSRLTNAAIERIDSGYLNRNRVGELARDLGVSARHLGRVMEGELGVTPIELAQTRRLGLAKHLLQDTTLPVTRVAFASGFSSVRRFNALFRQRFDRAPSEVRRGSLERGTREANDRVVVRLDFRPPLAWDALLEFVGARAIDRVETVDRGCYRRWVAIDGQAGWVEVRRDGARDRLTLSLPIELVRNLPSIVARVRRLFDLDARPDIVDARLRADPFLAPMIERRPGLRVAGAFDAYESAVRCVLGQQISVRAAADLCDRFASAMRGGGERSRSTAGDAPGLSFPTPERVASASVTEIGSVGMPASRARTILELSRAVAEGRIVFEATPDPEHTRRSLESISGIGPWTTEYILMRVFRWPNAFPAGDRAIQKMLAVDGSAAAQARSRDWEPWRAYAAVHLWQEYSNAESGDANDANVE